MSVILHVEDDPALSAVVALSLEGLGFHDKRVNADTVERAEKILDDAAIAGDHVDLIISDMHLPDGTGLDLVRYVRSRPAWATTPMIILSADETPTTVRRAYALGANAYVSKSPPGRTITQVVTALYQHWIKDAVPIGMAHERDDMQAALTRAMSIPIRFAHLYQRFAEQSSTDTSEATFWLSRALCEANLVNALGFVQQQLVDQTVDADLVDGICRFEAAIESRLTVFESELDRQIPMSRDELYARFLDTFSVQDIDLLAHTLGRLFPVIPVGIAMLRDFLFGHFRDTTVWIENHTTVPATREYAKQLRAAAAKR